MQLSFHQDLPLKGKNSPESSCKIDVATADGIGGAH